VSQLCKRTHPKSLSWKERDFSPLLFTREGGKGDELFNLFITTQLQNEKVSRKTTKPSIFFNFSNYVQFFNTTPLQN
jgi:hypothetical protein